MHTSDVRTVLLPDTEILYGRKSKRMVNICKTDIYAKQQNDIT